MSATAVQLGLFTAATVLWAALPAAAQEAGSEAPTEDDGGQAVTFTLSPNFRYQFSTGLDQNNGDFRVFRGGLGASADWAATDKMHLVFSLDYEYNRYEFDPPNTFLTGTNDPFSDIHILDLGVTANVQTDGDWSWFAGVRGRLAGEGGVDIGDAGTIGGMGGVAWRFGKGNSIGIGALVSTQIEDDVQILPIIKVNWRINDQWRFASSGAMGEFIMAMSDDNEIAFGVSWEDRRFRLDDSAPQLSSVIEDSSIPLFIRFSHKPSDTVALNIIGGVTAWQQIQVSNRNGSTTRDFDADPAPFVGLSASISF